jgi:starch phosphorylase
MPFEHRHRTASFQDLAAGVVSPPEMRPQPLAVSGSTTPVGVESLSKVLGTIELSQEEEERRRQLLWSLMSSYLARDVSSIQKYVVNHLEYSLARTRYNFDRSGAYHATALSVRDRLIEAWNDTQQYFTEKDCRRVYYLSLEFLMGRFLDNALINLGLREQYKEALIELGFDLDEVESEEREPGLGNGGLGRLAACFLDSIATLNYPGWGYGIRYRYGMFEQRIKNGYQLELPDFWLTRGNPFEIERLDVSYPVYFGGDVSQYTDNQGRLRFKWNPAEVVLAVAFDSPIPGYDTYNCINLRLWDSKPAREFDLSSFNVGDYYKILEMRQTSETLSAVLYPNDSTEAGKELRLKQQYFFVSATLQDIIRRFLKKDRPLTQLAEKVCIQLNDTHPTIGIVELMRLLLDENGLGWTEAWKTVKAVFSYTNHTVLPEALEKWPVPLMERLLPRHMQLIYEINFRHLQDYSRMSNNDGHVLEQVSIIEESFPKMVRMAQLAVVGSHTVNGVAEIHSELVRTRLFPDFNRYEPKKFTNVTNGVTPRRWILEANPALSAVFSRWTESDDWILDLNHVRQLEQYAENPDLQREFFEAKKENKRRLAEYIREKNGVHVDVNALFDIQVKRIHEYKRQLLNILGVIARYNMIKSGRRDLVPRVFIFGGKAAAGYAQAKRIIRLINGVADVVNNDPDVGDLLKVVFLENYSVSLAELIIPASDISEHISTAGMEASGTSNMKFVMNGGLIIGTMDGANIEIREEVGPENIFIFGLLANEIDQARNELKYRGWRCADQRFQNAVAQISRGMYCGPDTFQEIVRALDPPNDFYLVSRDFASYMEAQDRVDAAYKDQRGWLAKCIVSTARMGKFSSDRSIHEYAERIWHIEPCAFTPSSITYKEPVEGVSAPTADGTVPR